MLEYSTQEVLDALSHCDNLNAAIKSYLKREVQKGDPREKFTKTLRSVFQSGNVERQTGFIEKNKEKFDGVILAVTRYALYEPIDEITADVIEEHAEEFNNTYEVNESGINITDDSNFKNIAGKAIEMFRAGLKDKGLPASNFLLNVLILTLFDDAVIPEVMPIAANA